MDDQLDDDDSDDDGGDGYLRPDNAARRIRQAIADYLSTSASYILQLQFIN